jgi:hypothetical protein
MVKPARVAGERIKTAYWIELLVDGKIVLPDKLSSVRQEWSDWDERHARKRR